MFTVVAVIACVSPTFAADLEKVSAAVTRMEAQLESVQSKLIDVDKKLEKYDANIGVFYRDHHIPKRDEWRSTIHQPEFKAALHRVDRLERNDDLFMGALIIIGFMWTLFCGVIGWLLQGLRIQLKTIKEEYVPQVGQSTPNTTFVTVQPLNHE